VIFLDRRLVLHVGRTPAERISGLETLSQRLRQGLLVGFDRQNVVAALVDNRSRNVGLTSESIEGDDAAIKDQRIEQGRTALSSLPLPAEPSWPSVSPSEVA